ncbi:MAG: hypothetical protein ACK5SQ_13185, partial [Chitinophagales bacterium]
YIPVTKAGNYVWFDNDLRGDEMTTDAPIDFQTESGINGVDMVLVWGGLDGNLLTVGDNRVYRKPTQSGVQGENEDGIYYFCGLTQGEYRVLPRKYVGAFLGTGADTLLYLQPELATPARKILTIANNTGSNDYKDSDGTPVIAFSVPNLLASPTASVGVLGENSLGDLPTIYNYADRLTNMGLDFGFVQEPNIELNQQISGIEKGGACGQFKVIVDLCITNTGGYENGYVMATPVNNLQAEVALKQQLGAAFLMTMGAPQIMNGSWECADAPLPQSLPTINPNFNGDSDKRLFNGTSGLLWPGEKVVVRYVMEVKPSNVPEPASLNLTFNATGSAKAVNYQGQAIPNYFQGGAQYMAMDVSNDGLALDGTYNDPDLPTSIGDCWKETQTMASNNHVQVAVDENCEALITEGMILEGEDESCVDEAFCLKGYYRVRLMKPVTLQPVPNPIPASYLGQTLMVVVENVVSCNTVMATLTLVDHIAPVVTCTNFEVSCAETNMNPSYLSNTLGIAEAFPTVVENCTAYTQSYSDVVTDLGCNTNTNVTATIARTWVVKDGSGNVNSCTQTINVMGSRITDVVFPSDVTLNSAVNVNTQPGATGTPVVVFEYAGGDRSYAIWPAANACEIQAVYSDQVLPICDGSYKIVRTWTVLDACLPTTPFPATQNPQYYVQVINVVDSEGPTWTNPEDMTVSTNASSCCANVDLPNVVVRDNSSRINRVSARIEVSDQYTGALIATHDLSGTLTTFGGNNVNDLDTLANFGYTPCLPVGVHQVTYVVEDDCGNTSSSQFILTVEDQTPPVAVCDEWTQVSLINNGTAEVYATTYDDGSYDNCGPVFFKARRMINDSVFNDVVKFDCTNVGDTITVILRVYDVDPGTGPIAIDAYEGDYNDCMVNVLVEDKIKPICTAPANVTVSCEAFDPSLQAYGQATAVDNCSNPTITGTVAYNQFDSLCNKGTITRRWTAVDAAGNTATGSQRIVVTYNQNYYVKFPDDRLITTCDGTGNYGQPEFYGAQDCELMSVSYTDEFFTVIPDACFKIERTWTVLNWCQYNPNGACITIPNPEPNAITNNAQNRLGVTVSAPGTTVPGWEPTVRALTPGAPATNFSSFWNKEANCYKYKQIIKVIDAQDPELVTPSAPEYCDYSENNPEMWNAMYWYDNTINSHDLCEGDANIELTATDACSGANIRFKYLLFLDLDGNG